MAILGLQSVSRDVPDNVSHPRRLNLTMHLIAADRREAAHYSCDTRAQISMPSYV